MIKMCSGNVHATIGLIGPEVIMFGANKFLNLGLDSKAMVVVGVGAVIGSLIVDIDSKRSKASQIFNKALMGFIAIYFGVMIAHRTMDVPIPEINLVGVIHDYKPAVLLLLLTFVSHLSPHRVFTHKIIGTLSFIILGLITFNRVFFYGYAIGYILHLIADAALTKEKLEFFELRLPLQNSKGEFHVVM